MGDCTLKEKIRKSWDEHPCCYPKGLTRAREGTEEFYKELDQLRYQGYPHIFKLIRSLNCKDKKLLEVGCGIGADLSQFARLGAKVVGIDLTSKAIELTKKRFEIFGLKGDLRLADTENLPFPDNQFDLVYSIGVLHHTPDTEKAIKEIYRVLKPSGETIVLLYNKNFCTYYLELVLRRWILSGKFLFMPFEKVRNDLEYKGCPLAKLFSKREAKRLFKEFQQVEMQIFYIHKGNVPLIGRFIPQRLLDILARRFGFHLIIKARK